ERACRSALHPGQCKKPASYTAPSRLHFGNHILLCFLPTAERIFLHCERLWLSRSVVRRIARPSSAVPTAVSRWRMTWALRSSFAEVSPAGLGALQYCLVSEGEVAR